MMRIRLPSALRLPKVLMGSRLVYIEAMVRLIIGCTMLSLGLGFFFHPELRAVWIGVMLLMSTGLIVSYLTQFCLMAYLLRRFGLRSEWDELKALERTHAIAQTRADYLDTFNLLNEVIVEMAPDGTLLWKSDKWPEMFGNTEKSNFRDYLNAENLAVFDDMTKALVEAKTLQAKVNFHSCDVGNEHWLEGRFTQSRGSGGNTVMRGVFRDVTDTYEESLANAHRATHDRLTDLPNRVLFEDRLAQARARADRNDNALAVLFIDIDHFKEINDQMGHQVGDQVLISVATALREGMRPCDTASRWGGDEFVVLLPDLQNIDSARIVAEGLLGAARNIVCGDSIRTVTFSIGVAVYPNDTQDTDELLVLADKALYLAKSSGRNNVQFAAQRHQAKNQSAAA